MKMGYCYRQFNTCEVDHVLMQGERNMMERENRRGQVAGWEMQVRECRTEFNSSVPGW